MAESRICSFCAKGHCIRMYASGTPPATLASSPALALGRLSDLGPTAVADNAATATPIPFHPTADTFPLSLYTQKLHLFGEEPIPVHQYAGHTQCGQAHTEG